MKTLNFYIKTFGCQMNEADSDIFSAMFTRMGMNSTDKMLEADVILFNTCSVRDQAENKALTNLLSLKNLKKTRPDTVIVFAGCAAQRLKDELPLSAPHVDIVLGTRRIYDLPELLEEVRSRKRTEKRALSPLIAADDRELSKDRSSFVDSKESALQVFVPIMRGCNNYCSYCIVPYVRGAETCRPAEKIVKEIESLSANGCKEVTLLGQNVNSYINSDTDFAGLLNRIDNIKGIERIRFMTSHPKDFSDKLIDTIAGSKKVCRHCHLPLQSGSDRILKSMNRVYDRAAYLKLVEKIRSSMPGASISTDLIVGYPGETDADFLETLSMVEKVGFDSAYTFKYSPRPGTKAAKEEDSVSTEIKMARLDKLNKLLIKTAADKNKGLIGTNETILVEYLDKKTGKLMGKTDTCKQVFFKGDTSLIGKLINVRITEAHSWTLHGSDYTTLKTR